MMDRSGNRWCEDSSKYNGERSVYHLLDKHQSSSEKINDFRETNKISIQTSKSTVNLNNALVKSYVSSHSINNFLEIRPSETPSEGKEDFVCSIVDRFPENQTKVIEFTTGFRLREPAYASTGHEWESVDTNGTLGLRQLCQNQCVASVIPVEARPSNKDAYNFNSNTTNNVAMQESLSADNKAQYEKDLPTLLKLLKDKYPFHDETNKNILYDDEIKRFAKLFCITNFCPVLSCCDDLIFWLKDPDGVIYIWSRTDDMMIRVGCDMKEALANFLFHQENLCYVDDYTLELIPVKKAKEEAKKWYEESKSTEITFVVTDESLKPLEEKKKGSKKGEKQKKRQKRKNKH
jgi:hypothetical protein